MMKHVFGIFIVLILASFALGQGGPGGPGGPGGGTSGGGSGTEIKPISPWLNIQASVGGLVNDQNVSGTNINFNTSYMAFSPIWVSEPGPEDITNAVLSSFQVTINDEPVQNWSYPTPSPSGMAVAGGFVRFASNHFAHNDTITIKARGTFLLQNKSHAGSQIFDGAETVTKTITVKAYNRHSVFANFFDYNGQETDPNDEDKAAWPRKKAAEEADAAFNSTALKHSRVQVPPPYNTMVFPLTHSALTNSTVWLAYGHGTALDIRDSGNNALSWSTVANQVALKSAIPGYNLVMLYACETLTNPNDAPSAFGITGSSGSVLPDRGFVGFNEAMITHGFDIHSNLTIRDHSAHVIDNLKNGKTLSAAVIAADGFSPVYKFKPGVDTIPSITDTIVKGDGNMRMHNVYGGADNWFSSWL